MLSMNGGHTCLENPLLKTRLYKNNKHPGPDLSRNLKRKNNVLHVNTVNKSMIDNKKKRIAHNRDVFS